MARGGLHWSIAHLAKQSGVTGNSVSRFENSGDTRRLTIEKIRDALAAGNDRYRVEFGNGQAITVRLVAKG